MDSISREPLRLLIRRRPGMFVGGIGAYALRRMLVEMARELLEARESALDRVVCRLAADGSYDLEATGITPAINAEHFITDEHAEDAVSGPLSSFAIASAMCDRLHVTVVRDGRQWAGLFSAGVPCSEISVGATTALPAIRLRYSPDPSIFTSGERPDYFSLCGQARDWAAFFPRTRFTVEDEVNGTRRDYLYPQGLISLAQDLEYESFGLLRPDTWHCRATAGPDAAEAVFIHRGYGPAIVHPFVNREATHGDDALAEALRNGVATVAESLTDYPFGSPFGIRRTDDPLSNMTVFVSVCLQDPRWRDSHRGGLDDDHARELVRQMVIDTLPGEIARTLQANLKAARERS